MRAKYCFKWQRYDREQGKWGSCLLSSTLQYVWVSFWVLHFVPLTHMSVLTPILHCSDYCIFIMRYKQVVKVFKFVLLRTVLALLGFFACPYTFQNQTVNSYTPPLKKPLLEGWSLKVGIAKQMEGLNVDWHQACNLQRPRSHPMWKLSVTSSGGWGRSRVG